MSNSFAPDRLLRCSDAGEYYVFLANNFHFATKPIICFYKARKKFEPTRLIRYCSLNTSNRTKIKSFFGTPKNTVTIHI